ncbi:DUF3892 domain-containing protein [Taibaiella koreensis]|uniref:DUF3892 domain-containing protein n=1 Tax=Taibaiella koreensis TaxID=1268548 RepID=UPI000E59E843|nr:DUF3892 domain-containing protein [Taibaiella koreensis]
MGRRITCITKSTDYFENPLTAIQKLGWINDADGLPGSSTRKQMYDWVKAGGDAYVKDSKGNKARLTTAVSPNGTEYVKTEPDNVTSDNLLSLPNC